MRQDEARRPQGEQAAFGCCSSFSPAEGVKVTRRTQAVQFWSDYLMASGGDACDTLSPFLCVADERLVNQCFIKRLKEKPEKWEFIGKPPNSHRGEYCELRAMALHSHKVSTRFWPPRGKRHVHRHDRRDFVVDRAVVESPNLFCALQRSETFNDTQHFSGCSHGGFTTNCFHL